MLCRVNTASPSIMQILQPAGSTDSKERNWTHGAVSSRGVWFILILIAVWLLVWNYFIEIFQMDQKQVPTTYKLLSLYNNIVVVIVNNYNYDNYCGSWVPND